MLVELVFAAALAVASGEAGAIAAPLQSTQAAPASGGSQMAIPPKKEKLICEDEEVTGSRLQHRRTCLTADQWRDVRRQLRLDVEHSQNLGESGNGH